MRCCPSESINAPRTTSLSVLISLGNSQKLFGQPNSSCTICTRGPTRKFHKIKRNKRKRKYKIKLTKRPNEKRKKRSHICRSTFVFGFLFPDKQCTNPLIRYASEIHVWSFLTSPQMQLETTIILLALIYPTLTSYRYLVHWIWVNYGLFYCWSWTFAHTVAVYWTKDILPFDFNCKH